MIGEKGNRKEISHLYQFEVSVWDRDQKKQTFNSIYLHFYHTAAYCQENMVIASRDSSVSTEDEDKDEVEAVLLPTLKFKSSGGSIL